MTWNRETTRTRNKNLKMSHHGFMLVYSIKFGIGMISETSDIDCIIIHNSHWLQWCFVYTFVVPI